MIKGYANDSEIRANGASGGVVTAFFAYLLDCGIVDRVICADFKEENATYRIISNSEELKKHQRSYYIPVPMNLVIQEIKSNDLKYAIVGTPCQLQGLTKAEEIFPKIKEKIVVKVGLFCGYIQKPNREYTQIDVAVATKAGIIVFEVKDYSGWIFGNEHQKYWTQILAFGKEKHRFYNPVMQNYGHIQAIRIASIVSNPSSIYSFSIFSLR